MINLVPIRPRRRDISDFARRMSQRLRQIDGIGSFVQLNVGAPWICNECERAAVISLGVRPIQFDSGRFELLDKTLQVRHVKADMVEYPPWW